MTFAVVEDFVGIPGDVDFRNLPPRFGVEDNELGWKTAPNKKPVIITIQRHRKISEGKSSAPRCDHFAFVAIDHHDLM